MISEKKEKFAEAYDNYYAWAFSIIFNRVDSIEDTQDICHDLFLRFLEKIDTIENYRSWLIVALRYEVLTYYRKKKPEVVDPESFFEDPTLTFVNGARDARVIMEDSITRISEVHGEVDYLLFDLISLKRFTVREAGLQLGLSTRQARYRHDEIIRWLKNDLRSKGIASLEDLL